MRPDPLRSVALAPLGSRVRAGCWGRASVMLLVAAALCLVIGTFLQNGMDWSSIPLGILGGILGIPAIVLRLVPDKSPPPASLQSGQRPRT
jgi:hypothetical protein